MCVYVCTYNLLYVFVTYKTGSSLKPGPEPNIFSSGSSSSSNPTHSYINHNGNGAKPGSSSAMGNNGYQNGNGYMNSLSNNNNNNNNGGYSNHNNNNGHNGGNGASNGNGQNGGNGQYNNPSIIDPHYVFGAPQSIPVLPNLPIFPYNSPTLAPSFQQFPQPNHPGSVLNPGVPQGLQPVNPYNPPFVFGQQPFYNAPGGTGGPPGGSAGILGGSGGGLAPYPGGYPSPNMYNKPPPQYQNQNPYNRQTQTHPNSAGRSSLVNVKIVMALAGFVVIMQKFLQFST